MGNTPNVRFKGFTEDWEQRKFADFTWDAGKRNKEDLDLEPYAITNEHGFIRQCDAHDDFGYMKDTDRKAYNIVRPNSFAYNPARINVGSIGYYKGMENVIVSSLYEVFQTDNDVSDRFLWHWFKSDEFPRWIERLQEGSVRLYFYYDKLCECQIYMPSLKEQEKIASFLDALDNLITLHQQKCDETKEFKKYMLQNMFPQKDEKVPKIRFDGFTGDWEQRKLSEISDFITKGATPTTYGYDWQESGIPFFRNDAIKDNKFSYGDFSYISEEANEALQRSEIHGDDILVAITGDIGKAGIVPKSIEKGNINQHTARVRIIKDAIPYFVYQSLITDKQQKKYQLIKTGLSMPQLSLQQIRDTIILCPSVEEQSMIGECFINLDNLITLHQQKCNALKEFKKYMLQNMFQQKGENKCQN